MATLAGTVPKPVRRDRLGVLRVGSTRVSLDLVIQEFRRGADAAEIQRNYDTLSLAEIYGAISFYLHNKAEVDVYLAKQEELEAETRRRIEERFPPDVMREKILARKERKGSESK